MKKCVLKLLLPIMMLSLSGCAFFEFAENDKYVVDLGNGDTFIKWNLVENNNEYRPVQSAYFEINKDTIKYYEDGNLKKEGHARILYYGLDRETRPLTIAVKFGLNEDGIDPYDELVCYTEDAKESVHQFTIMAEGYRVKALRNGGVPVRDYHLSDMPYAFGTYVKEGTERSTYTKPSEIKVGESIKLNGTFIDEQENKFYFLNNRQYRKDGYYYTSSNTYFRYENNVKNISIEGTIRLSVIDSWEYNREVSFAILTVLHGTSEPSSEKGVALPPDYQLVDFLFSNDDTLSFTDSRYYYENNECDWDPANFVAGTYVRYQN